MKINSLLTVLFPSIFLIACGGGSSSGGEQNKNLSSCVSVDIVERTLSFSDTTIRDYTYTNLCGEPVNLSTAGLTTSSIATIALAINGIHSDSVAIFTQTFIACRPPSVGIDSNTDQVLLQFGCS